MEEEKPRLTRLTAIMTQLQSKRLVTARDLADKHTVSIRTIYRDVRTLIMSGIPIVTVEGKGYSIMEGFHLPPVMFSEEEANALITAEQIIANDPDNSLVEKYHNAIQKIRAVLKSSQKDKTELLSERLQIRSYSKEEKTSVHLMQLQIAITGYNIVSLNYLSLQEKLTVRNVEPFALIHTEDNWVMIAYCRLRNDFRAFRLDRIQKLQTSSEQFEPHKMSLQEYFEKARAMSRAI